MLNKSNSSIIAKSKPESFILDSLGTIWNLKVQIWTWSEDKKKTRFSLLSASLVC